MEFTLSEKAKALPPATIDFLQREAARKVELAPFDLKCDNNCGCTSAFSLISDGRKVGSFCGACGGVKAQVATQLIFDILVNMTIAPEIVPPPVQVERPQQFSGEKK